MLALPGMLLTIAGIMVVAHFLTDLSWPLSLALAAIGPHRSGTGKSGGNQRRTRRRPPANRFIQRGRSE
jgi:hypothetical protein